MRTETKKQNSRNTFSAGSRTLNGYKQGSTPFFYSGSRKENFIQKIIRKHQVKQEQKIRKQLNFLFQCVFQHCYDSLEEPVKLSDVDLPEFMYDKTRREKAERIAFVKLLYRVADKKTVCKLYAKRIKQFKSF